jgi:hypothetical protein
MTNKNKKNHFLWLWICVVTLILIVIVQFFQINRLDSKNQNDEISKSEIIQTSSQIEGLQAKIRDLQQQYDDLNIDPKIIEIQKTVGNLQLLGLILTFIVIALIFFDILRQKRNFDIENDNSKLKKFVKKVVLNSTEISWKFGTQSSDGSGNVRMFEDKLQKLERQFGELQTKFNTFKNADTNQNDDVIDTLNSNPQQILTEDNINFFRSKQGKILQEETSRENAIFKIYSKGSETKFEYCGGVQNPDFFTEICSFENNPADIPNKTKITTTVPGIVKKDSDNSWEVITPAKIKFE